METNGAVPLDPVSDANLCSRCRLAATVHRNKSIDPF